MGMMPHPERALYQVNTPDYHLKKERAKRNNEPLPEILENNVMIFKNAVDYAKQHGGNQMEDYREIIRQNLHNVLDSGYIPELGKHKSGKVRDVHFTSDKIGDPIIMVASDRVSSFDHILSRRIPFKGMVLNLFNKWAMDNSKDIVPNASVESPHPSVLIQKYYKNIMVECVVSIVSIFIAVGEDNLVVFFEFC